MAGQTKRFGVCLACAHASTCTFPSEPNRPVFFCEEFEVERREPRPAGFSGGDVVPSGPLRNPASDEDECARYKGLCSNCDERQTCKYPKPDGGVWHCEEYR